MQNVKRSDEDLSAHQSLPPLPTNKNYNWIFICTLFLIFRKKNETAMESNPVWVLCITLCSLNEMTIPTASFEENV